MLLLTFILGIGLPEAAMAVNSGEGWLSGWNNRIKLIIDHTRIEAPLSNFPVLVHLSQSSGIKGTDVSPVFYELETSENRKKIAFTTGDGITQCYAEIEKWDVNSKQAVIWVKMPFISDQLDTIFYLYYDRHQNDNSSMVGDTGSDPAQKVWDSYFTLVMHMAESGNGIEGEFKDSSAKGHNGTGGGSNPERVPNPIESKIGNGQLFDGVDDYIEVPDRDDFSPPISGSLTISAWISPAVLDFNNSTEFIRWMGKGKSSIGHVQEWHFVMYNQNGNDRPQRISFYLYSPAGGDGSGSYTQVPVEMNQWVYITGKVDNRYTYMYRDGCLTGKDDWVSYGIRPKDGSEPVRIGTQYLGTPYDWWNGRIDEVRISVTARSDAWIKASYYSEDDNLIIFEVPGDQSPVLQSIGDKSVNEGELLIFTLSAIDPDDDPLTFSAKNLPRGAVFDSSTRTFSWSPGVGQRGTYGGIHFEVTDGVFTDFEDITITVNPIEFLTPTSVTATGREDVPPDRRFYLVLGITLALIIVAALVILFRNRLSRWFR